MCVIASDLRVERRIARMVDKLSAVGNQPRKISADPLTTIFPVISPDSTSGSIRTKHLLKLRLHQHTRQDNLGLSALMPKLIQISRRRQIVYQVEQSRFPRVIPTDNEIDRKYSVEPVRF